MLQRSIYAVLYQARPIREYLNRSIAKDIAGRSTLETLRCMVSQIG
jgi:hypothetical protein